MINLSSSGGGTYSWAGPNGFSSTSQNPTINPAGPATAGTYTVTVTVKAQNENNFAIDTKQLSSGVYFFRLKQEEGLNSFPTLRFIKQ